VSTCLVFCLVRFGLGCIWQQDIQGHKLISTVAGLAGTATRQQQDHKSVVYSIVKHIHTRASCEAHFMCFASSSSNHLGKPLS